MPRLSKQTHLTKQGKNAARDQPRVLYKERADDMFPGGIKYRGED